MRPGRDIRPSSRGSRDGCNLVDACGRGNCCHEGVAAVVSRPDVAHEPVGAGRSNRSTAQAACVHFLTSGIHDAMGAVW
jgi:hypothetical protein